MKHFSLSTFLFDQMRSGRIPANVGNSPCPQRLWSVRLPNLPPRSPESTAAIDSSRNLYFGCHDGYFYSLCHEGRLRWRFRTGGKIYASPLLLENDNLVAFASGDGNLYAANLNGEKQWKHRVGKPSFRSPLDWLHARVSSPLHERNRIASAMCWSSPNITFDKAIVITGYSLGLTAIDISGNLLWSLGLGVPASVLTGTCINEQNEIIACGQQGPVFCVSSKGAIRWHSALPSNMNVWGNPSVNPETGAIYIASSKHEHKGVITCLSHNGRMCWQTQIMSAIRGTVTISRQDYVIVPGYDGRLRFLDKYSGKLQREVCVAREHLWTSVGICPNENLLVATIDSDDRNEGAICYLSCSGNEIWRVSCGKSHAVPIVDQTQKVFAGSWNGDYFCVQT